MRGSPRRAGESLSLTFFTRHGYRHGTFPLGRLLSSPPVGCGQSCALGGPQGDDGTGISGCVIRRRARGRSPQGRDVAKWARFTRARRADLAARAPVQDDLNLPRRALSGYKSVTHKRGGPPPLVWP
jgi:hypothetical protein